MVVHVDSAAMAHERLRLAAASVTDDVTLVVIARRN